MNRRVALVALVALVAGCGGSDPGAAPGAADAGPADARTAEAVPFIVNATLTDAPAEGRRPAGRGGDGTAILPGGRRLTPAGTLVEVGGFPLGARLLPGGRHLVITDGSIDTESLSVVDVATRAVVQTELFPPPKSLFLGLAVRADGHLFVSGGGSNVILEYGYDPDAATPLTLLRTLTAPAGGNYVAGLAFVDDKRLLVAFQLSGTVALIDTTDGSQIAKTAFGLVQPYDIVAAGGEAYVSLWGTSEVAVLRVGEVSLDVLARVAVGKNPEAMVVLPGNRLAVACSDSDSLSIVDLDSRTMVREVDLAPEGRPQRGLSPTSLALTASRIYVAASADNAVDVFSAADLSHLGRIPTAWYPTAIVAHGDELLVTAGKGLGAGSTGGADDTRMKGTLSFVPEPGAEDLAAGETQVEANNLRPSMTGPTVACPASGTCRWPLPPQPGMPTPIKHIVLIQRENKTYDATLGDLEGSNGDPKLAMFGEKYTPNLHALARAYTNGDNFYSNAEASIQGHQWTTGGIVNDFTEKAWLTTWGRHTRPETANALPISGPEGGYYFQRLARAGVDYVSYGEIVGIAGQQPTDPAFREDTGWPGGLAFNLTSKDVDKAKYYADRVADGLMAQFQYVLLPNNHTEGLSPGKWTPEFMVADNDEATGRIVDTISHSPFWKDTVIIIIEDDPSDGYDHVEAHRSTLVVVSPWVRRGYVTSVHYDYPSMWRTIELLVGMPPQVQTTAYASPMFDLWATTPDLTPYTFIPSNVPEARNPAAKRPPSKLEQNMDFSRADQAPGLGKVLWRHMKGTEPPWELPWDPADADGDGDGD